MVPRQLGLPLLKALAARLTAAMLLEALPLTEVNEEAQSRQESFLDQVRAAADKLQDEKSGRLDESLRRLSVDLASETIDGESAALDELRERLKQLANELKRIDCSKCAKSDQFVCRGDDRNHDASIVSKSGQCIAPLKEVASFVERQTRQIYTDARFASPTIIVSTSPASKTSDQGMLKHFDIGGYSEVLRGQVPISVVGLEIRERAFDWNALCAVLYIMAHETICHAFQGLDGGVRVDAEEKCAWTEGWMDRLAFKLTQEWLASPKTPLPNWLHRDRGRVEEVAGEIHRRRYEATGTLLPTYRDRRYDARLAFDKLWEAWGTAARLDRHRVTQFSTKLNGCNVSPETRQQIVLLLGTLLKSVPMKFEISVRCCAAFTEHGNANRLLIELRGLREMSLESLRPS